VLLFHLIYFHYYTIPNVLNQTLTK